MSNNSLYSPLMPGDETGENKGGLVIIVVIIILMLIGGLFVINAKKPQEESTLKESPTEEQTFSTSTNLDDIDNDINELEASMLNSDLNQLDEEINTL